MFCFPLCSLCKSIREHHGLSGTIREHHGLSGTIRDYQGPSGTIRDYQGLSEIIKDYQGILRNGVHGIHGLRIQWISKNSWELPWVLRNAWDPIPIGGMVNATIPPRGMVLQGLNMYQKMTQKQILWKILPRVGPEWPQENHSPWGNGCTLTIVLKRLPKDLLCEKYCHKLAPNGPTRTMPLGGMVNVQPFPKGEWFSSTWTCSNSDPKTNSSPTPIPIRDILHFLAWALSFL